LSPSLQRVFKIFSSLIPKYKIFINKTKNRLS